LKIGAVLSHKNGEELIAKLIERSQKALIRHLSFRIEVASQKLTNCAT
jgi:hypothetical protein